MPAADAAALAAMRDEVVATLTRRIERILTDMGDDPESFQTPIAEALAQVNALCTVAGEIAALERRIHLAEIVVNELELRGSDPAAIAAAKGAVASDNGRRDELVLILQRLAASVKGGRVRGG